MMNTTKMSSALSNSESNLPDHVHIYKVADHDYYKPLLLESLEQMITKNNIQPNEKGYYYDFNLPNAPRTYKKLMDNILYPYAADLGEEYGLKFAGFNHSYWFQQYMQGSDFGWHQHDGHWAVVYYLELPEISEGTEFLNYDILVEEGDIIFFPTFLVHRSPSITSNQRKTIIATNISLNVDRDMIKLYGQKSFKH